MNLEPVEIFYTKFKQALIGVLSNFDFYYLRLLKDTFLLFIESNLLSCFSHFSIFPQFMFHPTPYAPVSRMYNRSWTY